jgi:hypothetical protein
MIKIQTKPMFEFPKIRHTGYQGIRDFKLPTPFQNRAEVKLSSDMVRFNGLVVDS